MKNRAWLFFASMLLLCFNVLADDGEPRLEPVDGKQTAVDLPPVLTLNRKDDGYRGIWYMNQPSGDEYVYKYSGGLGTYCAKHKPFAVYCESGEQDVLLLRRDDHGQQPPTVAHGLVL